MSKENTAIDHATELDLIDAIRAFNETITQVADRAETYGFDNSAIHTAELVEHILELSHQLSELAIGAQRHTLKQGPEVGDDKATEER